MISYAFMLIFGMFFAGYLEIASNIPVFLVTSFVFGLLLFLNVKIQKINLIIIFSVGGIAVFLLGGLFFNHYYENLFKKSRDFILSSKDTITVTVTDDIRKSESSSTLIVKTSGNILINLKCYTKDEFLPGDVLIVNDVRLKLLNKENHITSNYRRMLGKNTLISASCYEYQITKKGIDNTYLKSRFFYNLRNKTFYSLVKYLDFQESAFAYSVVSSDKSYLSNDVYQKLVRSGLVHISSVSGFHFAFLCGLLMGIAMIFLVYHRRRIIFVIIFSTLFMFYAGEGAAVTRAYFMFIGSMVGDLFYSRRIKGSTVLVIVTALMMVYNPLCIYDNSFLLSFFAIYGIIFLNNDLSSFFKGVPSFLRDFISLNLSVTIFILPVIYSIFGRINVFSALANLLTGSVVGFLMILTFLLWLSDMFFKPLCFVIALVLKLTIKYIFAVISFVSKMEIFKITYAFSVICAVFLIGSIYFLVKYLRNINDKSRLASFGVLICAFFVSFCTQYCDNKAYITFLSSKESSGVDIIYKKEHIVVSSIDNFIYNMYNSSLKQNEKIKAFVITDSNINTKKVVQAFENYKIENIIASDAVLEKLKTDSRIDSRLLSLDDISLNNFDICFNYNKKYDTLISVEAVFNNKRFIITDNLYYIFENRDKLSDCTILFSGNETKIKNVPDIESSVKIVSNSDLPMITVE